VAATGPTSVARTWGSTPAERSQPLPCDRFLAEPRDTYHRAVDVGAPAPVVFRWLCQLRAAPYSYDWIDNLGVRSPRTLTPGLDRLAVGQTVMTIFGLVEFERDRHLTLLMRRMHWAFGEVACTYLVTAAGDRASRLLVRLHVRHPGHRVSRLFWGRAMPWLDLVMMRKQLLNLAALSERMPARPPRDNVT